MDIYRGKRSLSSSSPFFEQVQRETRGQARSARDFKIPLPSFSMELCVLSSQGTALRLGSFILTGSMATMQSVVGHYLEKLDESPKGPLSAKYVYLLTKMKKLIYTSKELKVSLHLDDNDTESESSEEDQQQKQEGDINLYKNLVNYTYQTVLAGDKNRAKLAFYNMIQKAEKLGKIDKDSIVKLVTGNQRVRIQNVPIERITKAYTKAANSSLL